MKDDFPNTEPEEFQGKIGDNPEADFCYQCGSPMPGHNASCSIAIRERNAEIAKLEAQYDKALAGWQAERQLTGDDIQALAPILTHQDASYYDRKAEELNARLTSKGKR